ncbi:hypothetical protein [Sphingobacterium pedocola]|uniref:Uncharacterized protein n=1 Tax=Sphingobacterium pedocola TaxID=2082722 RepID=A0ABR9TCJ9_9SPHI|nr:hypothetical protein [Sphingobacterium pedocola]MBE8723075.1 hypothetical protein [Sphingobacterium pedocola]
MLINHVVSSPTVRKVGTLVLFVLATIQTYDKSYDMEGVKFRQNSQSPKNFLAEFYPFFGGSERLFWLKKFVYALFRPIFELHSAKFSPK